MPISAEPQKISMAELQRLMRDPEIPASQLRPYFIAAPQQSTPFAPGIIPNPDVVDIAPPADELEGAMMINWASNLTRQRRQIEFRWRRLRGDRRPVLVAEGDSWFNFPILLEDVIDQLSADYTIWSVDAPGDTLQNMVIDNPEYLDALRSQAGIARAFLFSGAGNDIVGEDASGKPIIPQILRKYSAGKPAEWYLGGAAFAEKLKFIEDCYVKVLTSVGKAFPSLPVLCHSYDFAIPGGNPGDPRKPSYAAQDQWIGKPMRDGLGIHDPKLQREIVKEMITRLSQRIAGLCGGNVTGGKFPNAWYVETPSTLTHIGQWNDELHPTDAGYALVADKFRKVLRKALGGHESDFAELEPSSAPGEAFETFACDAAGVGVDAGDFEAANLKPKVNRSLTTAHKSSRGGTRIDHIVIHYTTSRNIGGSIEHFRNGSPRTSAHYIIGRDGELVQMVPDSDSAWHAGSKAMNLRSIGIEHVAAPGDEITPAQASTSAALIGWLMREYGIPRQNVIPHCLVKPTSCCGDLFRAFGGGAGKSAAVQQSALQQWLASHEIGAASVAPVPTPAPVAVPPAREEERQRDAMAKLILAFEARRDAEGRLAVHELPPEDGGGRYEVAGINERYHKAECDRLVALIRAGRHDEAELYARSFILSFTARAADWTKVPALELTLRDAMFNRGAGGAARILQRALAVEVDGAVGAVTIAALRRAEARPRELLDKLRQAREWYERSYARRDESSRFWRGLVNRWNKLHSEAVKLLSPAPQGFETADLSEAEGEAATELHRPFVPKAGPLPANSGGEISASASAAQALPFIQPKLGARPFADLRQGGPLEDPAGMLTGWRALRHGVSRDEFERQVGKDDTLPAAFLEALAKARLSVCRIQTRGVDYRGLSGSWTGTGFLIAPDILLTNNHVLNDPEVAAAARVEFDYEITSEELTKGQPEPDPSLPRASLRLDPQRLFLTSPALGGLDYSFVGISADPARPRPFIPVRRAAFAIAEEERAFIIHHPAGKGKRVSLEDVAVVDVSSSVIKYTSDTLAGSSGAPVFDRRGRLIGLHHKGIAGSFELPDKRVVDGMNEAVKLSAIALDLEARHSGAEAAQVERLLTQIQGADSMAGLFGNLGRESLLAGTSGAASASQAYLSTWLDIDLAFLDFGGRPLTEAERRDIATTIIDLGGDIWCLEGISGPEAKALAELIGEMFSQRLKLTLLASPEGSGLGDMALLWNAREVEIAPLSWPETAASLWDKRDQESAPVLAASPPLLRITAATSGVSVNFLPLGAGLLRHPLALALIGRGIAGIETAEDWLIAKLPEAEMAAAAFAGLADRGYEVLSLAEPQGGGISFLRRPGSRISRLHVPRDLSPLAAHPRIVVAQDRSARSAAEILSTGLPLMLRLSLAKDEAEARPVSATLEAELDRLLAGREV